MKKKPKHNDKNAVAKEAASPPVPVSVGDTVRLRIEALNHDGEGVGRLNGFTVFVPGALPGEVAETRVISLQKRYARALPASLAEISPYRREPHCDLYNVCGGCQLLHLDYQEQLRFKEKTVSEALRRIGGTAMQVRPIIGMETPWRYRNKIQVPFGVKNSGIAAGYYGKRSHDIIDMKSCLLQRTSGDLVINTIRRIMEDLEIPAYNEKNHSGLVRHVLGRQSFSNDNLLIVIVTNGRSFPRKDQFIAALRDAIPGIVGIVQNINTGRTNIILGAEEITLWGEPWLWDNLGGFNFKISPGSFFQINPLQTEALYEKVVEYAALTGSETVFDLYCGIGTISLFLAHGAGRVIGVELDAAAVEDAKENVKVNGIGNVDFYEGAAEKIVPYLYKNGNRADVAVVDPPRKGCAADLLETMTVMQPQRIVYVSCNPATLARDLGFLKQNGYFPREAQAVDMFPQTTHVETVVWLQRK